MIRARVVTKTPGRFVDVFDSVLARDLAEEMEPVVVSVVRWVPTRLEVFFEVGTGGNDVVIKAMEVSGERRVLDVLERAWS